MRRVAFFLTAVALVAGLSGRASGVWPPSTSLKPESQAPAHSSAADQSGLAFESPRGLNANLDDDERRLQVLLTALQKQEQFLKRMLPSEVRHAD